MARATVQTEGQETTVEATESLLGSGMKLMKSAREEAGELVHRFEENAGALKEKVQSTLGELQEVSLAEVPASLQRTYETQSKRATEQVTEWKKKLTKGSKTLWKDLLKQLRKAGTTLELGVEPLIHGAGLASKRDIQRIEKKLERLIRKVDAIEKGA